MCERDYARVCEQRVLRFAIFGSCHYSLLLACALPVFIYLFIFFSFLAHFWECNFVIFRKCQAVRAHIDFDRCVIYYKYFSYQKFSWCYFLFASFGFDFFSHFICGARRRAWTPLCICSKATDWFSVELCSLRFAVWTVNCEVNISRLCVCGAR